MTVRWGIIGVGDVVRKRVGRAIADDPQSELIAACRRDQPALDEFCRQHSVGRSFTRDADLIADREIDAVYIATPVHCHLPQTVAAANAGKHVLVEKPMALSVAECDQMIDVCRERGIRLGVAYYRRFYPIVERMAELIAAGTIGTPLSVSAVTATAVPIHPGDEGSWRVRLAEGGGGALMDIGSHRINLFVDLFGKAIDVKAFCETLAADYKADDCATLIMRMASGVHGSLRCYFGAGYDPDEFSIMGTEGRLFSAPLNRGRLIVETRGNRRIEEHPPAANFSTPLIADFVTAIKDNREPRVTGDEGRLTNLVMERAYADSREILTAEHP